MAKKKKKLAKKPSIEIFTIGSFMPMEPPVHPNEDQEDPLHDKYEKTIEITPWGPDWR